MPGSVQAAQPVGVFPVALATAFAHSRAYPVVVNEYPNGESQRSVQSSDSRRNWRQTRRLGPDEIEEFLGFYIDHKGPVIPFYFYDPWDTDPPYTPDPTGAATTGRYTCRFGGPLRAAFGISLADVSFEIVEVF